MTRGRCVLRSRGQLAHGPEVQAVEARDDSRVVAVLTPALGAIVVLSLVRFLRTLGRPSEPGSRQSPAQQRPGDL